jgi:hypothetical protein
MRILSLFVTIFFLGQSIFAQTMHPEVQKVMQKYQSTLLKVPMAQGTQERGNAACTPDSTVLFDNFTYAPDSFSVTKVLFQYDSKGNEIKRTTLQREEPTDAFEVSGIISNTYNAQNVLIKREEEVLDAGNNLILAVRNEYYPKGTSTILLDSTVNWGIDQQTEEFGKISRVINQYQPTGEIIGNTTDLYDELSGWVTARRTTTTLNALKKPTLDFTEEWDGSMWFDYNKFEYKYDASDSLALILETDLVSAQPVFRSRYVYDIAEKRTTNFADLYQGGTWVNAITSITDLDALNRLEFVEFEIDFQPFLVSGQRSAYFYNGTSECPSFELISVSEDAVNYIEIGPNYYYYKGSIINILNPEVTLAEVAPNPVANQGLRVASEVGSRMELFNALGQLVLAQEATATQSILPTAQLDFGTYFLKIRTASGAMQTAQVVKVN